MRENTKSFFEILEEKLAETKNEDSTSSTHRAKNSHFVNEKVDFSLSISLEKILFRPKNSYPHSDQSVQILLEERLLMCKNEEQKSAVRFFFDMGAREFLIVKNEKLLTKSYRKLATKLHPDKFAQKDIKTIEIQKNIFVELQKHYNVLKTLAKSL